MKDLNSYVPMDIDPDHYSPGDDLPVESATAHHWTIPTGNIVYTEGIDTAYSLNKAVFLEVTFTGTTNSVEVTIQYSHDNITFSDADNGTHFTFSANGNYVITPNTNAGSKVLQYYTPYMRLAFSSSGNEYTLLTKFTGLDL